MHRKLLRYLQISAVLSLALSAKATTILQGTTSQFVAFEGESAELIAGTPENWVVKTDPTASGGKTLITEGSNSTGDSPHSFAQFNIKFATEGTYYLYYRWQADPARTAGDIFTANSFWIARALGALSTPGASEQGNYIRADSNNMNAPDNSVYNWRREVESLVYNVTAAEITAGVQVLTIGTREAGLTVDRVVLSTDPALNGPALDALVNSETDVAAQDAGATFVAFEAETKSKLIAGTPENWVIKDDPTASGGKTLITAGQNSTGDSPHSFAQFNIQFATEGTYYLYYRWQAEPARTAGDIFTANSFWIARTFGALATSGSAEQPNYIRADSNNMNAPDNSVYNWRREVESLVYTVTSAEIQTGPQVITFGTREAGLTIDRIVLSTDPALTGPALDALLNSGASPVAPEAKSAVGSAALNTVRLDFTRPLALAGVAAGDFTIVPSLAITGVTVDPDDSRIVRLVTAAQTEGTRYTVNVTGVQDTSGTPIAAGASIAFTAWKRAVGWATKEVYFGVSGASVDDLYNHPKYLARTPDRLEFVKGFQMENDPLTDNYGARLSAFFVPAGNAVYDFFPRNDDEAEIQLSPDMTEANLSVLGRFPLQAAFDETVFASSPALTAGQSYLLAGFLKQNSAGVYLNVAARRSGDTAPVQNPLGGARIWTFVNPDLSSVEFTQQPGNPTVTAGSRATFRVKTETKARPVYYQWQVNGADIPGAIRNTYITPVLTTADSGKAYRCIVSVAGAETPSNTATLTVNPGSPSPLQPYIGVNFVGGGTAGGASLIPEDVAGAVEQANWNNLAGTAFDGVALADANGSATPVTLSAAGTTIAWYTGANVTGDGNGLLFHGFVNGGASLTPVTFTFANVPAGEYFVLAYSMGFDFAADYREAFELIGATTPPVLRVKAETGLPYTQAPAFRRMNSTDPDARAVGNYVQFDRISPAPDGTLTLNVTWESDQTGNGYQPAVNALQLVRFEPPVVQPRINAAVAGGTITISWSAEAAGFTLQSSAVLGTGASWTPVGGVANPITGAGSANLSAPSGGGTRFYRMIK